ncbi:unnamed protein product [Ambrosiozyma monospora]|uniref:Unnamed protein product n=1 Tax=Ambrosiozyma monospora TaxID=43982 RepID=A0A9W6Z5H5_AMBMO|nr:unnamed protein product [Ambrosiozyma monospora]
MIISNKNNNSDHNNNNNNNNHVSHSHAGRYDFAKLEEFELRVSESKLHLLQTEIFFLGYLIKDGQRFPAPDKISALHNWHSPTVKKDWLKFIGYVNWLHHFILDCAKLLKPLYDYVATFVPKQKPPPVPEAVASNFEKLKLALANSVGLKLFDPAVPTLIMTDASDLGIGGFIAQKLDKLWYPIAFISKSFTPTQRNYSTLQRELLGAYNHLQ